MKQPIFGSKERAQSLTELAISFTFLMLLLSGSVDLGRAFFSYLTLSDASQEGAVYGAMNPADIAGIEARALDAADSPINLAVEADPSFTDPVRVWVKISTDPDDPDVLDSSVLCAGVDAGTGNTHSVTVWVYYNFHFVMPLMSTVFPSADYLMNAKTTNTILRPACP